MATFFITMHACLAAVIESYTDRRWQGSSHIVKMPQLWKGLLTSKFYTFSVRHCETFTASQEKPFHETFS